MRFIDGDVAIRLFNLTDKEPMVELGNNPRVSRWLADRFPNPYTEQDADHWLSLVASEGTAYNLAITWRNEFVGGIGLDPLSDIRSGTAELGYWLGEPYWGKGIVARAVQLIVPYAFEALSFVRVQAAVFSDNKASMRVLEKSGFVKEGVLRNHFRKNGVVSDAILYSRIPSDEIVRQ